MWKDVSAESDRTGRLGLDKGSARFKLKERERGVKAWGLKLKCHRMPEKTGSSQKQE